MRNRFLYALEILLRKLFTVRWPKGIHPRIDDALAKHLFGWINALREKRFGVPCTVCEECGFKSRPCDFRMSYALVRGTLAQYRDTIECVDCVAFRKLFGRVLRQPRAA